MAQAIITSWDNIHTTENGPCMTVHGHWWPHFLFCHLQYSQKRPMEFLWRECSMKSVSVNLIHPWPQVPFDLSLSILLQRSSQNRNSLSKLLSTVLSFAFISRWDYLLLLVIKWNVLALVIILSSSGWLSTVHSSFPCGVNDSTLMGCGDYDSTPLWVAEKMILHPYG